MLVPVLLSTLPQFPLPMPVVKDSTLRPAPQQPAIVKTVGDEIHDALLGRKTPEQAMRAVWKTMDELLKAARS